MAPTSLEDAGTRVDPLQDVCYNHLNPQPERAAEIRTALLQRYRLLAWGPKVSNARLLLYAPLAYAIAGRWAPRLFLLNTAALLGLIMFQRVLNDYWDAALLGEQTPWGWGPSAPFHRWAFWALLPLGLCAPLVAESWRAGCWAVLALLAAGAGLAWAYAAPPLRIKTRRPWGTAVAPTLCALMFVEAHLVIRPLGSAAWMLAGLVWLFQLYAECLQVITLSPAAAVKCPEALAWAGVRWLPPCSILVAFSCAVRQPIFALGVAAGLWRTWAVRGSDAEALSAGHRRLTSPALCLYEFLGYFLWGVWRVSGSGGLS